MGVRLIVRTARDPDFPAILQIAEQTPQIVRYATYTYWVMHTDEPEGVLAAEEPSDGVVGYLLGTYTAHLSGASAALLLQIAVHEAARRRSVGRALVQEFAARCRERHVGTMYLTIDPNNRDSRSFFEDAATALSSSMTKVGRTGTLGGTMDEEDLWMIPLAAYSSPSR